MIASYGALGGGPWYSATIFIAFLSVAPLGFFIWHVGYSTRERDRRLGTRYPVKRGGYE